MLSISGHSVIQKGAGSELLEVKVPIAYLGTAGVSARRDGR